MKLFIFGCKINIFMFLAGLHNLNTLLLGWPILVLESHSSACFSTVTGLPTSALLGALGNYNGLSAV